MDRRIAAKQIGKGLRLSKVSVASLDFSLSLFNDGEKSPNVRRYEQ